MKKKTLLLLLIVAIIVNILVVAFSIYDLKVEIDTINIWIKDNYQPFIDSCKPHLIRSIINLVCSIIGLGINLLICVKLIKGERLILTTEEKINLKKEQEQRKQERLKQKREKKILQLTTKIDDLKNKDGR